jgi:sialidase-1
MKLNEAGLKNIDRIETYFNGSEPVFIADNRVGTITPSSATFEIPFKQALQPGLNYVWFSITLKENAGLDDKIEFDVTGLVDSYGKAITIKNESATRFKRIGIAVRKAGDNGVHTYRIPGIITTDKGTLIAVYDIRYEKSGDLPGNIDVGMSRSMDGGATWSPMKVIMDMGEPHANNGVGDPSILFDPVTKKIWVSALWSKGNRSIAGSQQGLTPDETGQFAMVSSSDDGVSWTQPYSITTQVKNPAWKLFFPGPGNGIAMQDGKIVFPAQYWDSTHMPHSTLVYSEDHGQTWKSGIGAKRNTTESQLVETVPGTLMLNMRDNRGGFRSIATTNNVGKEWLEHHTSYKALQDPVCMASFIKAEVRLKGQKKNILFFSNANSPTARINITIKSSLDFGENWLPSNQLLIDERRTFGYSALTKIDDNTIGLLYEGIRDLYFIRIPVNEIIR